MSRVSCIIPHFYNAERERNLQPITDSLEGVDEVIIWNNDEPIREVGGARIIQADHNWGCQGRFEAVKHLSRDVLGDLPSHVLFHDNDLITWPGTVQKLLDISTWYPSAIVSITGEVRRCDNITVQISRGRFELIPMPVLTSLLAAWRNGEDSVHDDIWLSVRAYHCRIPIRMEHARWRNLKDNVGFWHTPGFFDTRARLFQKLMRRE